MTCCADKIVSQRNISLSQFTRTKSYFLRIPIIVVQVILEYLNRTLPVICLKCLKFNKFSTILVTNLFEFIIFLFREDEGIALSILAAEAPFQMLKIYSI